MVVITRHLSIIHNRRNRYLNDMDILDEDGIRDAIKKWRDEHGGTMNAARLLKVKPPNLSRIMNGGCKPGDKVPEAIGFKRVERWIRA